MLYRQQRSSSRDPQIPFKHARGRHGEAEGSSVTALTLHSSSLLPTHQHSLPSPHLAAAGQHERHPQKTAGPAETTAATLLIPSPSTAAGASSPP